MEADKKKGILLENIDGKIEFEYEQFFREILRTSKSNIFARSSEIEVKKKIKKYLMSTIRRLQPDQLNRLFSHVNILEECYRYNMDHPCANIEKQIDSYLSAQ